MSERAMQSKGGCVLVFDSGLGGLSVLGALQKACARARFVYAADNQGFPYGGSSEARLKSRLVDLFARLIDYAAPDLVVIACNTASTLALGRLRDRFDVPFVGTVPAIKVAARLSRSRVIGVLATPGTARREYTQDLIADFAGDCRVVLAASPGLAGMAERKLLGSAPEPSEIEREIKPAFVANGGKRTDVVVLACTHYPFLLDELVRAAPWPVRYVDPADAIARQAAVVLAGLPARVATGKPQGHQAVFTADYPDRPALVSLLEGYGLKNIATL